MATYVWLSPNMYEPDELSQFLDNRGIRCVHRVCGGTRNGRKNKIQEFLRLHDRKRSVAVNGGMEMAMLCFKHPINDSADIEKIIPWVQIHDLTSLGHRENHPRARTVELPCRYDSTYIDFEYDSNELTIIILDAAVDTRGFHRMNTRAEEALTWVLRKYARPSYVVEPPWGTLDATDIVHLTHDVEKLTLCNMPRFLSYSLFFSEEETPELCYKMENLTELNLVKCGRVVLPDLEDLRAKLPSLEIYIDGVPFDSWAKTQTSEGEYDMPAPFPPRPIQAPVTKESPLKETVPKETTLKEAIPEERTSKVAILRQVRRKRPLQTRVP